MTTYYGTVEGTIQRTGVERGDLGDPDHLNGFIEELLEQVADLMDRTIGKSYLEETTIPAGLNAISMSIAADVLREMVATRQTPVVRIDDFAIRVINSKLMSPEMKTLLQELYSDSGGAASLDVGQVGLAGAQTVVTASDLDEWDGWSNS